MRIIRTVLAFFRRLFAPGPCPFGSGSSATCIGCALDRQWVGALQCDHVQIMPEHD